jgi:DNA-binding HxlR family transcriptional regulator
MPYSQQLCQYQQRALELLGRKWTGLIVLTLLPGARRFSELAGQLEVVSDRVLSERLKELEEAGVVERSVLPESPVRVEYRLTEKGQALEPVLKALDEWGHRWLDAG